MTNTLFVGELLVGCEISDRITAKAERNMREVNESAFLAGVILTPEQLHTQVYWERILLMCEEVGFKYYK